MTAIGNYEIIKQIGEGGFGRIFQAEHIYLNEKACIKQNINASEFDTKLLQNEAKLLWKLDEYHSIPSVKDFFYLDKNNAVMVLKFIEGKTLEDIVLKKKAIHPEDVCWIAERLLGALYYTHYHGVIHGDVKPQNVFVEPGNHDIKLIDFGLSSYKPHGVTAPSGFSPAYAAPELALGMPPVPETDIYGVGLVMLRGLGGEVAKKSFRDDTPKEIVEFCQRLLVYDPKERPNWEKTNLIEELSEIRQKVFGRRHISDLDIKMKGGKI